MKKKLLTAILILGIVVAAIGYGYKTRYAASIGIIGGADGPTAIFVAGQTGMLFYAGVLIVIATIAFAAYKLLRRKK